MITQDNITVGERLAAPKPKLFKKLGIVFGSLVGIATAIVAAPVALPAIVTTIAGYVIAASTVAGAVAALPVDFKKLEVEQALK